ncbi:MAG: GtrA family protein [Oscillospiraceae bacterium]|nr:GtrA family protein [Oscillospiraceae bacterium]
MKIKNCRAAIISKAKAHRAAIMQAAKFFLVGIMNTAVYYGIYYLLLQLELNYVIAVTAGTIAGMINGYLWSKYFVFKTAKKSIAEIVRFCVVYAVQYLHNIAIIFVCVTYLDMEEELAGLIPIVTGPIVSFVGLKFWGFKKPSVKERLSDNGQPPDSGDK